MPRACVPLADGFEEIEAITIVDVLRRAGVEVCVARVGDSAGDLGVTGSHGVVVTADAPLAAAAESTWDLVVLPGGLPGAHHLRDDAGVQRLLRAQHSSGRRVAAICAAPIALGAAGVLTGKRATSYPGFEGELTGADCVEDRVVRDGNVVTSRGPGTALDFSLALVEELCGADTAAELRAGMLVAS